MDWEELLDYLEEKGINFKLEVIYQGNVMVNTSKYMVSKRIWEEFDNLEKAKALEYFTRDLEECN